MFTEKDMIDILKGYRHIYLNDLQVIMGYIQLGRQDAAIEYIKKISRLMEAESRISHISDYRMQYVLIKGYNRARENFIGLDIDVDGLSNMVCTDEDYSQIENQLNGYIDDAVANGYEELHLRLLFNGKVMLERVG